MEKSLYDEATTILKDKDLAETHVRRIDVVLQDNLKYEDVFISNAYNTLQEHYSDKLVKYARLLLERNKKELLELIKCLDSEFNNL